MTQRYLLALAFVVAIAVASNVAPNGQMALIRAASNSSNSTISTNSTNSTNGSNHLILGARLPGDKLVLSQTVKKTSSWLTIITEQVTFNVTSNGGVITQVRALDQKTNGNGAVASLISGGSGHKNVTLRFKSLRGHGIHYVVELYSRL